MITTFFALVVLYSLVIAEGLLTWAAVRAAAGKPRPGRRWLEAAELHLRRLAPHRGMAIAAVAMLALGARALLLPVLPTHQPLVTDEYSYLLAGETFASGRLTNPAHPLWKHFESIHILQQPSYTSMYQPAQGLVLAAGRKLAGNPWIGVYLSAGAMCAAIAWMLYGWLPPRWALLGGILFALRIGVLSYWMNSYWGGAPAAIGGALLLGALPRLKLHWRLRDAVWFGLGIAILGASRPFEGAMTAAAATVILLVWMFGKGRPPWRISLVRVALPVLLIVSLAGAGILYYFQSVTGSPFRMPYVVQREAYATAQYFFWQKPTPQPVYRHQALRDFYAGWELTEFTDSQSFLGALWNTAQKLISAWLFFFGPLLTIPLLLLPRVIRSKRLRPLLIVGAVVLGGMSLTVWFYAHYAAPIAGLLFVALAQGLRHLRLWRRREGRAGARLVRAIPAVCLLMMAVRLIAQPLGFYFPPAWPMTWFHTPDGNTARASVLTRLTAMEGNQLAIVRYWPGHRAVMNEWVYNQAAIDQARVVWAREMDAASNRELIRYFAGRRVWLVEADAEPPKLTPYPGTP